MNKKYFFFDIDGTLTDRKTSKIVPSAQVALNELQKAGHFFKQLRQVALTIKHVTLWKVWVFMIWFVAVVAD